MDFQKGYLKCHLPPSTHTWDRLRWRGRCDQIASYCSKDSHGKRSKKVNGICTRPSLSPSHWCPFNSVQDHQFDDVCTIWLLQQPVSEGQRKENSMFLPVEHLSYFIKATQRKQDKDGFGLLVDLLGAQVFCPALQNIWALRRAQPHLETNTHDM